MLKRPFRNCNTRFIVPEVRATKTGYMAYCWWRKA